MEIEKFIELHDKRVAEVRELLAPVQGKLKEIEERYHTIRREITCDSEKQYLKLMESFEKLDTKFDSMLIHMTESRKDIGDIFKELNGNGKPGLIKRVYEHDKYFNMIAGGAALVSFAFAGFEVFKFIVH